MINRIKTAIKKVIKKKCVKAFRLVKKWDWLETPGREERWLMDIEGSLTEKRIKQISEMSFYNAHGYPLEWNDSSCYQGTILRAMQYYQNPLRVRCNDKFFMKSYVKEILGPGHTAEVFDWWTDPDDIDFEKLPDRFVLKVNWFGGGYCNIFVDDKSEIKQDEIRSRLKQWIKPDGNIYYLMFRWDARHISPIIFAEEYLKPPTGLESVRDYKLYCHNSVVRKIQVCEKKAGSKKDYWFDENWNPLDSKSKRILETALDLKPESWLQMTEIAEKLSAPFPFMRIDFYEDAGRVIVGEMTMANGSGLSIIEPEIEDIDNTLMIPESVDFEHLADTVPLTPSQAFFMESKIDLSLTEYLLKRKFLTRLFYWPDLKNPRSLNEKALWLALNWNNPLAEMQADRVQVKEYIKDKAGNKYNIANIGIYDDIRKIDWNNLPLQFTAKSASGYENSQPYFVKNKRTDHEGVFLATAGEWLLPWNTFYYHNACIKRRNVKPKVLIEEMIDSKKKRLDEYRFYCSNGKPFLICSVNERDTDRESRTYADPGTWKVLPFKSHNYHKRSEVKKPSRFDEMISLCKKLASGFPLVRIDFHETKDRVIVNNITLDGMLFERIEPLEWDYYLGEKAKLSIEN